MTFKDFISNLASARQNALSSTFNMSAEEAKAKVDNELLLLNAPANTGNAASAGDYIPDSVMLSNVVDTSFGQDQSWSFLAALSAGRQKLQSLNNEYPIIGEVVAAGGTTEWTSGAFYDGKNNTEDFTAGTITITPKGIYGSYGISRELAMYSMVDLVPLALKQLNASIMLHIAEAVVSSDSSTGTSNINCLGVAPSTALPKGVKNAKILRDNGLRKVTRAGAEGVTKIEVNTFDIDYLFNSMKLMSFGSSPRDYVIIMNDQTYWEAMRQDEFKNASINGQKSTIVTGALTNIMGMDLFSTPVMPLTDATGAVDASTPANNTQGSILIVRKTVIQHGYFGSVEFDTKQDIQKGFLVEAVADFGFTNISTLNGKTGAVLLYNIDL